MADEEQSSLYEDTRADIDTAVYAYNMLEGIDVELHEEAFKSRINQAKNDCIKIICIGIKSIKEYYSPK